MVGNIFKELEHMIILLCLFISRIYFMFAVVEVVAVIVKINPKNIRVKSNRNLCVSFVYRITKVSLTRT